MPAASFLCWSVFGSRPSSMQCTWLSRRKNLCEGFTYISWMFGYLQFSSYNEFSLFSCQSLLQAIVKGGWVVICEWLPASAKFTPLLWKQWRVIFESIKTNNHHILLVLVFLRILMHRYSLQQIIKNCCFFISIKTFVEMLSFYPHIVMRSMSSSFLLVMQLWCSSVCDYWN